MSLEQFDKHKDPEVRAWAMIWKAANVLQGIDAADTEMEEIISEISLLRRSGKLTPLQLTALDRMGENASLDLEF